MQLENTCFNCEKRHQACWASCEEYKAARVEFNAKKAERNAKIYNDNASKGFLIDGCRKQQRRRR